jgi:hypothetical protein
MPSLLVIRLHPVEPVTGTEFTAYLEELSITAYELSVNDPDGTRLGAARYITPSDPVRPEHGTQIFQHCSVDASGVTVTVDQMFAVATAVIEFEPEDEEYRTADVRLVIRRNDDDTEIRHRQIYYNVPVIPDRSIPDEPDHSFFINLEPSLYLALSPPSQSSPTEILPKDGAAPNFGTLRRVVQDVLAEDPGVTGDALETTIAALNIDQCRHIAHEIIWDPDAYPLPVPKSTLWEIYTGPQASDSEDERNRRQFEGDLLTYYTTHNAEADRLTNFVFALSAAVWCEQKSREATQVGFYFPIFLNEPSSGEAKVILTGLFPTFEVPAAYFYAITAILPPQVKREQRYTMVTLDNEAHTLDNLEQAIDAGLLEEPAGINRFQAARRLRALGAVEETGTAEYSVATSSSAVHDLVSGWLADTSEDINAFWSGRTAPEDLTGHLDLVLCGITHNHASLIAAIKASSPNGLNVSSVSALIAVSSDDWVALFRNHPDFLPEFTKPGTTEERIQAFLRHLRRFFDVLLQPPEPPTPEAEAIPVLSRPPRNPLDLLLTNRTDFVFVVSSVIPAVRFAMP